MGSGSCGKHFESSGREKKKFMNCQLNNSDNPLVQKINSLGLFGDIKSLGHKGTVLFIWFLLKEKLTALVAAFKADTISQDVIWTDTSIYSALNTAQSRLSLPLSYPAA
jgi:hypothetical protein